VKSHPFKTGGSEASGNQVITKDEQDSVLILCSTWSQRPRLRVIRRWKFRIAVILPRAT